MEKRILIIGRWVPFHNGHKYLVDSYLASGIPVCIAIRKTEEKYTPEERVRMIRAVYPDEDKVEIVIIPDICGVAVGRGVGYFISTVPPEIEQISATKVRTGLCDEVPPGVKKIMEELNRKS